MLYRIAKTVYRRIYTCSPRSILQPKNHTFGTMFVSQLNVVTGQNEWGFVDEEYDFKQEIARSDYGDMLHDTDRNKRYFAAIKEVISSMLNEEKEVRVLDIGTGSGLLSMMAVKCGANAVTACEAFSPIAKCASRVIERNGFSDNIKIVPKRSTELVVGIDMPSRANLLLAEVFDTELIGEGALETFRHAAAHLLTEDAVVIPNSALLYAIPVHSDFLLKHNRIHPSVLSLQEDASFAKDIKQCPGTVSLHDIQASALLSKMNPDLICALSESPTLVKRFDFFPEKNIKKEEQTNSICQITKNGEVHAFVVWWDLLMNPAGDNVISMAPEWVVGRPTPWRDHWMQAIYYPLDFVPRKVSPGDFLGVNFRHDEFSLNFDVFDPDVGKNANLSISENMPLCVCGVHYNLSRQRMARHSSSDYQMFCSRLAEYAFCNIERGKSQRTVFVCISDSSGIPVACLKSDPSVLVISVEMNEASRRFVRQWRDNVIYSLAERWMIASSIDEATGICRKLLVTSEMNITILGEPLFAHSTLPWHGVTFLFQAQKFRKSFPEIEMKILPIGFDIFLLPMNFTHLHKLRAPVKNCEGFDLREFDDMIGNAVSKIEGDAQYSPEVSNRSETNVLSSIEAHYLWEYNSVALSDSQKVISLNLKDGKDLEDNKDYLENSELSLRIDDIDDVNGFAVWPVWDFENEKLNNLAPNGGLANITYADGKRYPIWDRLSRQGVFFPRDPIHVTESTRKLIIKRKWSSNFGDLKLHFEDISTS